MGISKTIPHLFEAGVDNKFVIYKRELPLRCRDVRGIPLYIDFKLSRTWHNRSVESRAIEYLING